MADVRYKPYDSDNNFFDISVNTGQICIGFEVDKLKNYKKHVHLIRLLDKDLV